MSRYYIRQIEKLVNKGRRENSEARRTGRGRMTQKAETYRFTMLHFAM